MIRIVKTFIGCRGSRPPRPYVDLEDYWEDGHLEWLTPNQARRLAERLTRAAMRAETKYATYKAQQKEIAE